MNKFVHKNTTKHKPGFPWYFLKHLRPLLIIFGKMFHTLPHRIFNPCASVLCLLNIFFCFIWQIAQGKLFSIWKTGLAPDMTLNILYWDGFAFNAKEIKLNIHRTKLTSTIGTEWQSWNWQDCFFSLINKQFKLL